jgi:hypothetical protein
VNMVMDLHVGPLSCFLLLSAKKNYSLPINFSRRALSARGFELLRHKFVLRVVNNLLCLKFTKLLHRSVTGVS